MTRLNGIKSQWIEFCRTADKTSGENQLKTQAFLELHSGLQEKGIEVIPLKGLDLILRTESSRSLRDMADCDLLIHKKDIRSAMSFFESDGFHRKPDEGLTYISENGRINFDIIWEFWYMHEAQTLWENSSAQYYKDLPFRLLAPEDALLYLVTYVTAHRGVLSLSLARDVEQFLIAESGRFNWQSCIQKAVSYKIKIPFLRGLQYASENGCSQLPHLAFKGLSPKNEDEARLLKTYRKIVTEDNHPRVSYFFTWLSYPGLRGKIKLLREKLLPSKLEADIHWGPRSFPYYLAKLFWRPFFLIFRGIRILFHDFLFFNPRMRETFNARGKT